MTNSDLADFVYENQQKCKPAMFVNTYYQDDVKSPKLTTVLIVVNKKKEQAFREMYESALITFNE